MELFEETYRVSDHPFTIPLGKASCGPQDGIIGELDLLVRAGLPVPEGMVVTRDAHRAFLEASGLLEELLAYERGDKEVGGLLPELPRAPIPGLVGADVNRAICEALMELGAASVVVISDEARRGGLRSIPEVKGAILEVWLSEKGLERQVRAATSAEREIPTWPVLIQRETRPRCTGWSSTSEEESQPRSESERASRRVRTVALNRVELAEGAVAGGKGIAHLILEAESVLGEGANVLWGLEGGRWRLLSVVRRENNMLVERGLS